MLAAGCDGFNALSTADNETAGRGSFTLHLTDAPFPYELVSEANVWVDSVAIVSDDDAIETLTSYDPAEKFNLLELQNGITAQLFEGELEAGTYSQIRLYINGASIVLTDEQVFDLKVPSEMIKVLLASLTIEEGMDTELTLDFVVNESFIVQGNPNTPAGINGFIFKPVVKPINMISKPENGSDEADEEETDEGEGENDGAENGDDEDGGEDDEDDGDEVADAEEDGQA